jgi:hypothetical protein
MRGSFKIRQLDVTLLAPVCRRPGSQTILSLSLRLRPANANRRGQSSEQRLSRSAPHSSNQLSDRADARPMAKRPPTRWSRLVSDGASR